MSEQISPSISTDIPQLILCSIDPDWVPTKAAILQEWLSKLELIGERLTNGHFAVGESFLHYISFLGCSPAIELAVGHDNDLALSSTTHVYLSATFSRPILVFDSQQAIPRCPQCAELLNDWQLQYQQTDSWQCQACRFTGKPNNFRWRQRAVFARQFVSILNVFPQEAVPTDVFLNQLGKISGTEWQYAYCRCPLITY